MLHRLLIAIALVLLAACAQATPSAPITQVAPIALLAFGGGNGAALTPGYTEQAWRFVIAADASIRLTLEGDPALTLALLDENGQPLAVGAEIITVLPNAGTYTALVQRTSQDFNTTLDYVITLNTFATPTPSLTPTATLTPTRTPTLTPSPTPTPTSVFAAFGVPLGEIVAGQPIQGQFETTRDAHVYRFQARGGQYLNANLLADTLDPALTLLDPQGMPLAEDEDSAGENHARLLNIILPNDGVYALQARADLQAGAYSLTLTLSDTPLAITPTPAPRLPTATIAAQAPTPAPSFTQLVDHIPVLGLLESSDDFARYTLEAVAGEPFTAGVTPAIGSLLQPRMEIYDPEGALMISLRPDASGTALAPFIFPAFSGEYTIFINAVNNTSGEFVISYGRGASHEDVLRGEAAPNVAIQGALARRGLRDLWALRLNAGDTISIGVTSNTNGFNPALELIAPDGTQLAYNDNLPNTLNPGIGSVSAPLSGVYFLRVTGEAAASAGSYTLLWRSLINGATPTALPATQPLLTADDALLANESHRYRFYAQVGDRVRIRVQAVDSSALDAIATLYDANGESIAQGDDSAGSLDPLFEATLPTTGTYSVEIAGYGGSAGAYRIVVDQLVFQ
jgi:Bacterial pre-peptidase C-terminal domain